MAIYYLNAQIIGRSAGRSAPGAAAYRAAQRIHDERTGQTFDYTRRRGAIETEILAPTGAPEWAQDRAQLWNQVEKTERRGDAQLARELVVAIPKELDREQRRALVREYVQEQFVSRGMVADVAYHWVAKNPHAHIMLTMREIGPEGFSAKKNREWNRPELLEQWREQWATSANRALDRAGREERIDHRSLAEQGSERLPQVHLGPHASALERRGVQTEKGDHNRLVAEHNSVVIDLEKAREEKRQLEAAKAVNDRYGERVASGWKPAHAEALGTVEWEAGGTALTWNHVERLHQELQGSLGAVEQQIDRILGDELRLRRAEGIIENRDKAFLEVERLKSPLASVKRWFSAPARVEFVNAQARLLRWDGEASMVGVKSKADLAAQRVEWEQNMARIPELEEKAKGIKEKVGRSSQALEGFREEVYRKLRERERESERGPDREPWRERDRSRGMDRGR
jgi:hypothetical protein